MKKLLLALACAGLVLLFALKIAGQPTGGGTGTTSRTDTRTGPGPSGKIYEEGDMLLLETGDYLLLESGDKLLLE